MARRVLEQYGYYGILTVLSTRQEGGQRTILRLFGVLPPPPLLVSLSWVGDGSIVLRTPSLLLAIRENCYTTTGGCFSTMAATVKSAARSLRVRMGVCPIECELPKTIVVVVVVFVYIKTNREFVFDSINTFCAITTISCVFPSLNVCARKSPPLTFTHTV